MSRRLDELPIDAFRAALSLGDLGIRTGPFLTRVKSAEERVADGVRLLYAAHPYEMDPPFADFRVEVFRAGGLGRRLRPQVNFASDGVEPFKPLPANQAFPMLEWGLNWCIASFAHRWLLVHAAVLARGEHAVLMPAKSGSGKSTLCAAMAMSGWRLLSDEIAVIDPESGIVEPLVRPIGIKNQSIDVIRRAFPSSVISSPVADTAKGTLAHVGPPANAVHAMREVARVRWVVFPRWQAAAATDFESVQPSDTLPELIENAFNYNVLGERGFTIAVNIAREARAYRLTYSELGDALAMMETLA